MGVAISDWRLARAVSTHAQLGVVSGTALDQIMARRLQCGDPGGHMRRALAAFPDQDLSKSILEQYFVEGGKDEGQPFLKRSLVGHELSRETELLTVVANFAEIYLAKEGHEGIVGINYLHKIQPPLLSALFGALIAGVDIVIVGAGIPLDIPDILTNLCARQPAELKLHVVNNTSGTVHKVHFDPHGILPEAWPTLPRPRFFPIVSSTTLATLMVKKSHGRIDGLILEKPSAGGHNAPPRGRLALNEIGEPIYGARDELNLEAIKDLGLPFWLAGSYGRPEQLEQAVAAGATGVQVGTLFAFSEESGLRADLKQMVVKQPESMSVYTDPLASPTGFPFKVLGMADTLSEPEVYASRGRQCDLGFLREAYEKPNGELAWRCPAEHPDAYVGKGGARADTVGRKCLCNSLTANVGLAQIRRDGEVEQPMLTCGNDIEVVNAVLAHAQKLGQTSYSAADAINYLLSQPRS